MSTTNLLEDIDIQKLKKMSYSEVELLCTQIRDKLISTASVNGGHLAPNLGVVELTVALHRVFDSPSDQIMFDVGHQCYTHKLLTGRADRFSTIRTEGGLAGFPKPSESEHDPMISGHSSTSISAACGLARAKTLKGEPGSVIAVIGDGALTGGMAYEGLNNAGRCRDNIIVVLNDNKMSISKNVGAMARHLAVIRSRPSYASLKNGMLKVIQKIPLIGKPLTRAVFKSKSALKNAIYKNTLFDSLGFAYLGPIDGHNQKHLEQVFTVAKNLKRPVIVHVCTSKGKGYGPAEKEPDKFHGIGGFDIDTGEQQISGKSYSSVFGDVMCRIAREDPALMGISAAMKMGTGLDTFANENHRRFYDCGIAEEHAVTFCAGLAANGMKPVFAVYSSFIQRAYDQIIHDVAIQGLNVTFAIDRAGVVGEDGETHHGIFDVALLNTVPGLELYAPCYFSEFEHMLEYCIKTEGPEAIRYPRGTEPKMPAGLTLSMGNYDILGDRAGKTLIVSYGRIFAEAAQARAILNKEGHSGISVLKLNRIKPVDPEAYAIAEHFDRVLFFEEGIKNGGIGETFIAALSERGYKGKTKIFAIDEHFVQHASVKRLLAILGLDAAGIYHQIVMED